MTTVTASEDPAAQATILPAVLEIRDLVTAFQSDGGWLRAVDGVSFSVREREFVALVGESGSGKSVTALSILRLVDRPGKILGGSILFRGTDLMSLGEEEMRRHRGDRIAMIFQEPMASLNPVFRVGDQIAEAIRVHQKMTKKEALARAAELLDLVSIPDPSKRLRDYPHQMSGGMRQRVMIAMALSCDPDLLIADEPTTALDVTIQAQILELLATLQEKLGLSILLITHDLGIVAEFCQRVVVMYAGKVVEESPVGALFAEPRHPYTKALLKSLPKPGQPGESRQDRLSVIQGTVPGIATRPTGCAFHPRCSEVREICRTDEPRLVTLSEEQSVRCVIFDGAEGGES